MLPIDLKILDMVPPSGAAGGHRYFLERGRTISVEYEGPNEPWWNCRLTTMGEVFEFSCAQPALHAVIIANAIAAALSGDEQDNWFHIPEYDVFIRINLASEHEAALVLIFGGKVVDRTAVKHTALVDARAALLELAGECVGRKASVPVAPLSIPPRSSTS